MKAPSEFHIAIIGAGPAGCTLGRILSLSNIKFTIFESDVSATARSQGGSLDLHKHTGLAAVKAAKLEDEFLKRARYEGEAMVIADKNLKRYLELGAASSPSRISGGRPEIDRLQLRAMLLDSLPKGVLQWGRHLKSISKGPVLHFDDGDETGFDLVVGADGGWSRTREFLSMQKPIYTGVSGVEYSIPDAALRYPDLDKLVNKGTFYCYSDARAINSQQLGDGRIRVVTYGVKEEDWVKKNNASTMHTRELKTLVAKEYINWAPELRKLLSVAEDDSAIVRALYMLPVGFRWDNRPGVTVIGDAAHLMSPFAGEGANLAMADAMKLAKYIKKSSTRESLARNVAAFEEDMFKRAKPIQKLSDMNLRGWFFNQESMQSAIDKFMIRAARQFGGSVAAFLTRLYLYCTSMWRHFQGERDISDFY